ncbi:MAG: DUF4976 domain-containing protein [Planctomycetes bacterium]|nr:DUF4976 domain-containing protein [Planctomycetota bacterium]
MRDNLVIILYNFFFRENIFTLFFLPEDVAIRGRNFLPLLKGESPDWENGFYAQYSTHHQSKTHMRMYRTPDWKLIVDFNDSTRDELYSLKTDPQERENLIESKDPNVQRIRALLSQKLRAKMHDIDDPALKLDRGGF